MSGLDLLNAPIDAAAIIRKKRSIARELRALGKKRIPKRIAILGGSTTSEVKDILELFLLRGGIDPLIYESGYNQFFEDATFENDRLREFAPDLIYIHTSQVNVQDWPSVQDDAERVDQKLRGEFARFKKVWDSLASKYRCPIIQNNFDYPLIRPLGNLAAWEPRGNVLFVNRLNVLFAEEAQRRNDLLIQDIQFLSARIGLEKWLDPMLWYSFKHAVGFDAIPPLAQSIAAQVLAVFGQSKKCAVLDLDNTLWGGVIGDDGLQGIKLGSDTAEGEAFQDFQSYFKSLKDRGILLAVCSKNDERNAESGFTHPDTVLKRGDFSTFKANWENKDRNILEIGRSLNLGVDSFVFVDDNPVERSLVRTSVPGVEVPELEGDVTSFLRVISANPCFETVSLSTDDLNRSRFYTDNAQREELEHQYSDFDAFLRSLEMKGEISAFNELYLDRITQLINKTNQFNLTTKRLTSVEVSNLAADPNCITLYGRLADQFGDNGLVTVAAGHRKGQVLRIDLWLMSCRVLKRGLEWAMFDCLVGECRRRGITQIVGSYLKSEKNDMVSRFFPDLGFKPLSQADNGDSLWEFEIPAHLEPRNKYIALK